MSVTATGPDGKDYPAGDLEPLSWCSTCEKYKPVSEFFFAANAPANNYKAYTCNSCARAKKQAKRNGMPAPLSKRARVAIERRARVRELYESGMKFQEIADTLGCHNTTVSRDLTVLGINGTRKAIIAETGHPHNGGNVKVADGVVRQMAEMAALVHDGRRILLPLEGLTIDHDTAAEWEKSLSQVGKALRYLRNHAKKGNT